VKFGTASKNPKQQLDPVALARRQRWKKITDTAAPKEIPKDANNFQQRNQVVSQYQMT